MQYNIQVTSLRTDIGNAGATLEKERASKEKLETEVMLCFLKEKNI